MAWRFSRSCCISVRKAASSPVRVPSMSLIRSHRGVIWARSQLAVHGAVRRPRVVLLGPEHPVLRAGLPQLLVDQQLLQRGADLGLVVGVHEDAVPAVPHHVVGPPEVGGNDRQAAGRRFYQGNAEVLHQRRVDEHAAPVSGYAVQLGDVRLGVVLLGQRQLAVQVMLVHQQQQLGQHLALVVVHGLDVLAHAREDDQVGQRLQLRVGAVSLDEAGDVLAAVGPADGQDDGLLGLRDEAGYLLAHAVGRLLLLLAAIEVGVVLVVVGVEALQVYAGWHHAVVGRLVGIVELVPGLDLVFRGGDDLIRLPQRLLLYAYALVHGVLLADLLLSHAGPLQRARLVASQRVTRDEERHPEVLGQPLGHVGAVGVMAVHHVGRAAALLVEADGVLQVLVQVRVEELLAHVTGGAALQPDYAGVGSYGLGRLGVVIVVVRIVYEARQEVHALDALAPSQLLGQLHDVLRLPARVGVASQLEVVRTDQAVDADEGYDFRGSWHLSLRAKYAQESPPQPLVGHSRGLRSG